MSDRADSMREDVLKLVRRSPFKPFVINMDNGDRILVEHPENIAFDLGGNGRKPSPYVHVISRGASSLGTFDAVISVALEGHADPLPQED